MYALSESLAFLLTRTGAAMGIAFTLELKECGMTLAMWRVLGALWGSGEQTLSGLAEVTSVEISTLSRQVASLVEKKLVVRRQSGINWRSINIGLTPQGHALVERLLPVVESHERAAFNGINPADIRRLKLLLNKVYQNLLEFNEVHSLKVREAHPDNTAT
jgi:DNA-binding MarR family transcriptional regulator